MVECGGIDLHHTINDILFCELVRRLGSWGHEPIHSITDATGQIYGRMGHPERYRNGLMKNIPEIALMDIFKNGVEWFVGTSL